MPGTRHRAVARKLRRSGSHSGNTRSPRSLLGCVGWLTRSPSSRPAAPDAFVQRQLALKREAHDRPPRPDPCDHLRGWQRRAAHACDERAFETAFSNLSPASRALLLSQAGPHSSRPAMVLPTHEDVTLPSAHFRVLLLRRLRLPLPLAPRTCACRKPLDVLGDYRTACATAGVLASCAIPFERALARVWLAHVWPETCG